MKTYRQMKAASDEVPERPANPEADKQCPACHREFPLLYECDFCHKKFCFICYDGAEKEVGGGRNMKHTGWNCCYACGEQDEVQIQIHREIFAHLESQLQRLEREYYEAADQLGVEIEQARLRLAAVVKGKI